MNIRLASMQDLGSLKQMYREIVHHMNENGIDIWDDVYPCEFLKDDIENGSLYVLDNDKQIVGAFALCESNDGEKYVQWKYDHPMYIDRVGVHVHYLRQGIGSLLLKEAMKISKDKNKNCLRLFVVDINKPAIDLYKKNGFEEVEGIYDEVIDEDLVLHEYGFEVKL